MSPFSPSFPPSGPLFSLSRRRPRVLLSVSSLGVSVKADERSIRQRVAQVLSEAVDEVVLAPMGLIGDHHDVSECAGGDGVVLSNPSTSTKRPADLRDSICSTIASRKAELVALKPSNRETVVTISLALAP